MQISGPGGDWVPLSGSQFLDAAVSTGLTIPTIPAAVPAKGCQYVAVIIAQAQIQWIRTDGNAAAANVGGGISMQPSDFRVIYGQQALRAFRVIRGAPGGSLAVEFYYFRP